MKTPLNQYQSFCQCLYVSEHLKDDKIDKYVHLKLANKQQMVLKILLLIFVFCCVFSDSSVSVRCKHHSAGSGIIDLYLFYRLRHLHVFSVHRFIHAFPATVEYLHIVCFIYFKKLPRLQEQLFLCFNSKAKSNQATKILMNMFVALFLLNAWFLSNESVANTQDNAACVFIALLLHYSMLASFTWFFIQALHMYLWLIRQNLTITNYMRKITVLGWGELYTQKNGIIKYII